VKRIALLRLPDPSDAQVPPIEYADVIRQVIRRPMDGTKGVDLVELRLGVRVLDALGRATDVLELEDGDWEHLKAKVLAMPWAVVDPRILRFVDAVLDATEQVTVNNRLSLEGVLQSAQVDGMVLTD
jgi:hypothetical protein